MFLGDASSSHLTSTNIHPHPWRSKQVLQVGQRGEFSSSSVSGFWLMTQNQIKVKRARREKSFSPEIKLIAHQPKLDKKHQQHRKRRKRWRRPWRWRRKRRTSVVDLCLRNNMSLGIMKIPTPPVMYSGIFFPHKHWSFMLKLSQMHENEIFDRKITQQTESLGLHSSPYSRYCVGLIIQATVILNQLTLLIKLFI